MGHCDAMSFTLVKQNQEYPNYQKTIYSCAKKKQKQTNKKKRFCNNTANEKNFSVL